MKKPTDVAAYLRASGKDQETSVPDQRKAITAYCKAKGYNVVEWYVDDGISGSKNREKRDDFMRLLGDIEAGKIQRVVCYNSSRWMREDQDESADVRLMLREHQVVLDLVHGGERDYSNPMHSMMSGIESVQDNKYSRDIAAHSIRGKIQRVMEEGVAGLGGEAPYGLAREITDPFGHTYVVARTDLGKRITRRNGYACRFVLGDPEEVDVVRWLFDQVAHHDASANGLAHQLNQKGIASARGGKWRDVMIKKIIRNPRMCGAAFIGQSSKAKFFKAGEGDAVEVAYKRSGVTSTSVKNPEDFAAIVWDTENEAIVTKKLWDEANKVLDKRAATNSKPKSHGRQYVLRGILVCGHCGNKLQGKYNASLKEGKQVHYRCGCRPAVTPNCNGTVHEHEVLRPIMEMAAEEIQKLLAPKPEPKKRNQQATIQKLEKQIATLEARAMNPNIDDGLFSKINSQLVELRKELQEVKTSEPATITPELKGELMRVLDYAKGQVWAGNGSAYSGGAYVPEKGIPTSEIRQALVEMGLQIKVWFKDMGKDKLYGRWQLDRGEFFAAINTDCAGRCDSGTLSKVFRWADVLKKAA